MVTKMIISNPRYAFQQARGTLNDINQCKNVKSTAPLKIYYAVQIEDI